MNYQPEDISASEYEKLVLKKFRELHEKDDRALRNFNIVVIGFIVIASIICGSAIAIMISENMSYVRKAIYWLDDLPWTANLFLLLPCLAFTIWFFIHKNAKKQRQ